MAGLCEEIYILVCDWLFPNTLGVYVLKFSCVLADSCMLINEVQTEVFII